MAIRWDEMAALSPDPRFLLRGRGRGRILRSGTGERSHPNPKELTSSGLHRRIYGDVYRPASRRGNLPRPSVFRIPAYVRDGAGSRGSHPVIRAGACAAVLP